jgi:hypothetical protein
VNLSGVQQVMFDPPSDIVVSDVRSASNEVTATVSIGATASTGQRSVTVVSPTGRSNAVPFMIRPSLPALTISDLKVGTVTYSSTRRETSIPLSLSFSDPSGLASSGEVTLNFEISLGLTKVYGWMIARPQDVQPGQTSGTMRFPPLTVSGRYSSGIFSVLLEVPVARMSNGLSTYFTTQF